MSRVSLARRPTRPVVVVTLSLACWLATGRESATRGDVLLIAGDLQSLSALTQPGWTAMALDRNVNPLPPVQSLQPTSAGVSAGIAATLDGGTGWGARGLDAERATVSGTSFNDVVSDLWFNTQMSFTLTLSGLSAGTAYQVQAWHNDSYTVNSGAAAGGGTVTPSLTGGTVQSAGNGTVTNLRGAQSDASFGITTLSFIPNGSTATVTMTRTGGSFVGVPLSGVTLSTAVVPEPATGAAVTAAIAAAMAWRCRRRRGVRERG